MSENVKLILTLVPWAITGYILVSGYRRHQETTAKLERLEAKIEKTNRTLGGA